MTLIVITQQRYNKNFKPPKKLFYIMNIFICKTNIMSKEMRKLINQFRVIAGTVPNKVRTNGNLNEGHDVDDYRVAFHYKSIINGLRQRYENEGDYEWHTDPDILNAEEALREVGFLYDDESWDVFPNEG